MCDVCAWGPRVAALSAALIGVVHAPHLTVGMLIVWAIFDQARWAHEVGSHPPRRQTGQDACKRRSG